MHETFVNAEFTEHWDELQARHLFPDSIASLEIGYAPLDEIDYELRVEKDARSRW
jgi:hypothetical protein